MCYKPRPMRWLVLLFLFQAHSLHAARPRALGACGKILVRFSELLENFEGDFTDQEIEVLQKFTAHFASKGYPAPWIDRNLRQILLYRFGFELRVYDASQTQFEEFLKTWPDPQQISSNLQHPGMFAEALDSENGTVRFAVVVNTKMLGKNPEPTVLEEFLHARFAGWLWTRGAKEVAKGGTFPWNRSDAELLSLLNELFAKEMVYLQTHSRRDRALLLSELGEYAADADAMSAFTRLIMLIAYAEDVSGQSWKEVSWFRIFRNADKFEGVATVDDLPNGRAVQRLSVQILGELLQRNRRGESCLNR